MVLKNKEIAICVLKAPVFPPLHNQKTSLLIQVVISLIAGFLKQKIEILLSRKQKETTMEALLKKMLN